MTDARKRTPEQRHQEYLRYKEKYYGYNRTQKMKKFGITVEQYDELFKKQGGVCAICEEPESRSSDNREYMLAVDHDHNTNRVRGLLCGKCNKGLGLLGDTEESLVRALDYLRSK